MTKTHATPVHAETLADAPPVPTEAIEFAQAVQDAAEKASGALPAPDSPEFDRVMAELYPGKQSAVAIAESVLAGDEDDEDLEVAVANIAADGMVFLPDGSIRIAITVPPEAAVILTEWAQAAGEPLAAYIQSQCETGLNAIMLGTSVG